MNVNVNDVRRDTKPKRKGLIIQPSSLKFSSFDYTFRTGVLSFAYSLVILCTMNTTQEQPSDAAFDWVCTVALNEQTSCQTS